MILFHSIQGEGATVVFLHGFLESSTMWNYLPLRDLPMRCIFIDLPGHGNSIVPEGSGHPSIEAMANSVIETLEKIGVGEYHLVGHSMGAYVGLSVKERQKGCRKFLFLNSNCWSDDENKRRDRERVARFAFTSKHIFIREAIPNLFSDKEKYALEINQLIEEAKTISPEAIAYSALAMRDRKDYTDLVKSQPSDFMFIHGDLDQLVSSEQLKRRLENPARIKIIPNSGHMTHIENPSVVIENMKTFFLEET